MPTASPYITQSAQPLMQQKSRGSKGLSAASGAPASSVDVGVESRAGAVVGAGAESGAVVVVGAESGVAAASVVVDFESGGGVADEAGIEASGAAAS